MPGEEEEEDDDEMEEEELVLWGEMKKDKDQSVAQNS